MALEEGEQVDLLAMGRPEGQGCYCAVNHLLRQVIDQLAGKYKYIVVDNEAGMEHISRRTTRDVDLLLIVSDPSLRGLRTAASIAEMSKDIEVNVHKAMLIINRVEGEMTPELQAAIDATGLEVAALVPSDSRVNRLDALGKPLLDLDGDSPACRAVEAMTDRLVNLS
jgi:CO dehydrogenase maturation factor